jgi:hypothetical protein
MHNILMRYLGTLAFDERVTPTLDGLRYTRISGQTHTETTIEDRKWFAEFDKKVATGRAKLEEKVAAPIYVQDEDGNRTIMRKFPNIKDEKIALGKYRFRFTGLYQPGKYRQITKVEDKETLGNPFQYPEFQAEVDDTDLKQLSGTFMDHNQKIFMYEKVRLAAGDLPHGGPVSDPTLQLALEKAIETIKDMQGQIKGLKMALGKLKKGGEDTPPETEEPKVE